MLPADRLSANTFDKTALQLARSLGLGLEIVDYLLMDPEEDITEKRKSVSQMMVGFSRLSFHGTAVGRDLVEINILSDDELLAIYDESYEHARFHGIDNIVFHSYYLASQETPSVWVTKKAAFWKEYLRNKPASLRVYVENFIDDTPELLAELCDLVDDPRLRICLDVGHAGANSFIDLSEWIRLLGKRIGHVHLHNNDGLEDKHWPLGQGVLDMAAIIEALLDKAGSPTLALECDPKESLRWLVQNGLLTCPAGLS
ncbi:MAG TPA: sugar phosphate isomerase/epimerase [Firmicutes bacterium]|nr:sugar phosphate isomerase/epimerase [Candidatus Fermentithermobacillaceae bacterium]